MIKVLYLADPNSIHDIKWINELSSFGIKPLWLARKNHHLKVNSPKQNQEIYYIDDFSILRFPITFYTAFKIKKIIKKHQIDIFHILYAEPNSLWCNFINYFDIPIVITTRGTDVLKTIPEAFEKKTLINYIVAPLYLRAFLKADFITATSTGQLRSIERFSGRTFNTSIVRTGVDLQRISSNTEKHFPLRDYKPFILFPRYIKPIYNHEFCLEAIKLLADKDKEKYKMVFLGKDSGDLVYQKTLISIMSSMKDVEFEFIDKQPQEALIELYKKAAIVIMTPKSDGSPVSAMEAIACSAPVILGPLEYDETVFAENVTKLSSWEPRELATLIEESLVQKGKNSRLLSSEFLDCVSIEKNMRVVESIYRSLVDGTKE